ncbi:membrane protein [Streptomyces albiflavescens]|uniref:Membrane protein n=1 Tax=Streptomyces albiflavescens TaxID=1623582 RepID=A0A917Y9F7_9ACTN|nr:TIGR03943 family protein [Streptomyces albiflavescens]GGN80844.1 membrane protein [Streptomyces albiflavescens]
MRHRVQVLLLVLCGLGLLHVSLFSDLYLRYVKAGLRPALIASGALLLVLGLLAATLDGRAVAHEPAYDGTEGDHEHGRDHDHDRDRVGDHGHGGHHDHSTTPRIAWLLFLPALSLLLYAPPALGAYTAARANEKAVKQQSRFDRLPATSPLPITLTDFTQRVQQDRERSIEGRSLRMTGFVTPARQGGGWYLTRIIFNCCAADSQSIRIRMYGGPALPHDTWVSVTGTWHPQGTLGTKSAAPALDVSATRRISPPVNAYTDSLPLTPS